MPSLLKKPSLARLLPPRLHVGVALGGGAARALAHVGVLKVLAQAEIPIHVVTGCSLGAIAWADFVRVREIIVRGEAAARQALAGMSKKIRRRKWKKRIPFREELLRLLK